MTFVAMLTISSLTSAKAADYKPWLVSNPEAIELAEPPRDAALAEEESRLDEALAALTPEQGALARYWQAGAPNYRWMQELLGRTIPGPPSGPKSRWFALMNIAIYDAVVLAEEAKLKYRRARPQSQSAVGRRPHSYSYPSTRAAAAGAAAGVLAYLFPDDASQFDKMSKQAAMSRVYAGVAYPTDVEAGLKLGGEIAKRMVAYAKQDKSDTKWTGTRPVGPDKLKGKIFVLPAMSEWKTWIVGDPQQYLPAPPASIDSPEMKLELEALRSMDKSVPNAIKAWSFHATTAAYHYWYDRMNTAVFEQDMEDDVLPVALAYASVSASNHDALVTCFTAKYTWWFIRPAQLDPTVNALFPAPPHPSYPAAHSCSSVTYALMIGHFFPDHAAAVAATAEAAGMSRLTAGVHYPMDKKAGEHVANAVAEKVIEFVDGLRR